MQIVSGYTIVKRFHTRCFLSGNRGATNSQCDTTILMETVEGVSLSTGNHLNTEGVEKKRGSCVIVTLPNVYLRLNVEQVVFTFALSTA